MEKKSRNMPRGRKGTTMKMVAIPDCESFDEVEEVFDEVEEVDQNILDMK